MRGSPEVFRGSSSTQSLQLFIETSVCIMIGRGVPKLLRPYICPSCAKVNTLQSRRYAIAASPDIYDVICVGGGPAGLSLLTALRTFSDTTLLGLLD